MDWLLYRLEVKEPPAASSGKVYETVEGRCLACVVNGGPEEPCMAADQMEVRRRKTGRPCPYAALASGNVDAAAVVACLINDDTKPVAELYAEASMQQQELDVAGRYAFLSRIRTTLHNADVSEMLHPPPQEMADQQAARRARRKH